jgi:hypothetical protein
MLLTDIFFLRCRGSELRKPAGRSECPLIVLPRRSSLGDYGIGDYRRAEIDTGRVEPPWPFRFACLNCRQAYMYSTKDQIHRLGKLEQREEYEALAKQLDSKHFWKLEIVEVGSDPIRYPSVYVYTIARKDIRLVDLVRDVRRIEPGFGDSVIGFGTDAKKVSRIPKKINIAFFEYDFMGTAFATAYQRIRRAEEHCIELKQKSLHYFASQPSGRLGQPDPHKVYVIDKIKLAVPLPDSMRRLTIQAVENLRSALDHSARAVVVNAAHKRRTSFPFGDTKREFEAALRSKCNHVPGEIKVLFREFQPYKRGNAPLWALNKLCNAQERRGIVEPTINMKEANFDHIGLTHALAALRPVWSRRRNEIVFSRAPGKETVHHDLESSIDVGFGKVPVFGGQPVLAGLRYLTSIVKAIVMATEAEARRIGVVKQ